MVEMNLIMNLRPRRANPKIARKPQRKTPLLMYVKPKKNLPFQIDSSMFLVLIKSKLMFIYGDLVCRMSCKRRRLKIEDQSFRVFFFGLSFLSFILKHLSILVMMEASFSKIKRGQNVWEGDNNE